MKLFSLLKNKRGALRPVPALLVSGVVAAGAIYTANFDAQREIKAERAVRSLSSIGQAAPQKGLQGSEGGLTSINVQDSSGRLATAQERAAFAGNNALARYEANQRALENMDGSLGQATQLVGADGLNTGNRNVEQTPASYMVGNSADTGVTPNLSGAGTTATPGTTPAAEQGPRLAPAAITRASGGSPMEASPAAGVSSPGASSGGGTSGGISDAAVGTGDRPRLSGSMPGGSNIVTALGRESAPASTSFVRARDARVGTGRRTGQGKDELNDILKKSARAAANTRASGNEGSRAFLANAQTSGGITVEEGSETNTASSADLEAPTAGKLRAIQRHLNAIDTKEKQRQADQKDLLKKLLIGLIGSLALITAGFFIHKLPNPWRWIVAAAMIIAVAALCFMFMKAAIKFMQHYKDADNKLAVLSVILGPVLVGIMTFVAVTDNPWEQVKKMLKNIWNRMKDALHPVTLLMGQAASSLKKLIGI